MAVKPVRWSADLIRIRTQHLGVVEAPNEQAAIKKAAKLFGIGRERQYRISVRKLDERE
jgi:hypothetical protein